VDNAGKHKLGFGTKAFTNTSDLLNPSGISLLSDGNLLVADTGHYALAKFSPDGKWIESWNDKSIYAEGIDTDEAGNIYVFDIGERMVVKYSPQGHILTSWGGSATPADNEDAPDGLFNARCWGPSDLAVSGENVYVADTCDDRVQVFDLNGKFINKWGNTDKQQSTNLFRPRGIDVDSQGNVYVVDGKNRISVFSSSGEFQRVLGEGIFENPFSVTIAPDNKIYVGNTKGNAYYILSNGGDLLFSWQVADYFSAESSFLAIDNNGNIYSTWRLGLVKYAIKYP
jgi:DNA-binding beta-propeller fold protein YncE